MMQQLGKGLIGLILILLVAIPAVWSDSAENTNQAAVVVSYGDGSHDTACVTFTESTISGYELLSRSGLTLLVDVQGGLGAAVCSINGVGCPSSDCFCDAPNFWRYSYLNNNQWLSHLLGASSTVIEDGTIEGWSWGSSEPPVVTIAQACSAENYEVFLPIILKSDAAIR